MIERARQIGSTRGVGGRKASGRGRIVTDLSCLVTGAAGFIGSHLAEKLVKNGYQVVGIDSFTDYYPRAVKLANLAGLRGNEGFELVEGDLNALDLAKFLGSIDYVFHLAAQPGVRPSWGASFGRYVADNIMATQRLLEACKKSGVKKFVYASSSSIYGDAERYPTAEDVAPRPISPYGATKLAGEHLCSLYMKSFGVPVVVLRYFTVYGPRQRPDMAFHKFISSISKGEELEVYGDGSQSRDFTFVGDTVEATLRAAKAKEGSLYNVGMGHSHTVREAISILEGLIGRRPRVVFGGKATGDPKTTAADISHIGKELDFEPRTSLGDGLKRQVGWQLGKMVRQGTVNTSKQSWRETWS